MTQRLITKKSEVREVATMLCEQGSRQNWSAFWLLMESELLAHKVKFPLLEFVGQCLFDCLAEAGQLEVVTKLFGRVEDGSSVVAGKLLQLRLPHHFAHSFGLAVEGMVRGDSWYHCDQLGERVFGHGLLTNPDDALPLLTAYLQHENSWVRRAVGVAAHYATKKGLPQPEVEQVLALLLTAAATQDYQEQRGIGWGLKTIAKFYPDLMQAHLGRLPEGGVSRPVMSKIETGLKTAVFKQTARHKS